VGGLKSSALLRCEGVFQPLVQLFSNCRRRVGVGGSKIL
jgi:hypothetical protein